ncbi:hypothetical protein SBOR_5326 [Sclerotinia borealis F-4128]|uniref:Histidine-specific methyltransferase SAM-dependent domain-containing protein n=1 Tax=Sclerotinia borealis (strain F-4128) TaxID=1432307 RepID=W9CIF4_SCLBF|nr:hypothetical protein SBOR_5326 [Sclerotinia borealis F-4128]
MIAKIEPEEHQIHQDLAPIIVAGLRSTPRSFPSLLLWDEYGLSVYEKITNSKDYYPSRVEAEVLRDNVDSIISTIAPNSVILELGSGSLHKTGILLSALAAAKTPIDYYALDVSASSVSQSLSDLRTRLNHSPHVQCHPLILTYADSIQWLMDTPSLHNRDIHILWLGSSIANESPKEISTLFTGFAHAFRHSGLRSLRFLVGADGCKERELVQNAYDTRDGLSRKFVLNVLTNANRALEVDVFEEGKWAFSGEWEEGSEQYRTSIVAVETQKLILGEEEVTVNEGEKVTVIVSRKVGRMDMEGWCKGTGVELGKVWTHAKVDYSFFELLTTFQK